MSSKPMKTEGGPRRRIEGLNTLFFTGFKCREEVPCHWVPYRSDRNSTCSGVVLVTTGVPARPCTLSQNLHCYSETESRNNEGEMSIPSTPNYL